MVEAALARLDRLGLEEDIADVQESTRRANLFTSVARSLFSILYSSLSSTLNQIRHELRGVLRRVEAVNYMQVDEDVQIVSGLMSDIRDSITDYQVGGYPNPFPQVISFGKPV